MVTYLARPLGYLKFAQIVLGMTSLGLSLYVFGEFAKIDTDKNFTLGISDGWELFFIMTTFAFLMCSLFLLITHACSGGENTAISELIYNAVATIFILTASIGSIAYIAKNFTTNNGKMAERSKLDVPILQILKAGSAVISFLNAIFYIVVMIIAIKELAQEYSSDD